jgi:hypothetical protein
MVTVLGANLRMAKRKDMEHLSMLVGTNTSENAFRGSNTAMEYIDGLMEEFTMDSGNKIKCMVMDISGFQMPLNTMESSKII